ncbi:hypothetical protein [Kribbella shirazensis]|uniref:Uncharacterized protein n=1 Tax=Kribbella shirazensis TaxID=1105143 RepID=A0A7X5VI17_9ACTN|nr:hypothetical protein [Kribbella shirazensis]NIK61615.1 hypothetical protein [Kribbella shirazensis]
MPEARKRQARELLLDTLFDKVEKDRFPSISMLDMIESLLRPDEVQIYVRLLLRKTRREMYPSIPILRRIAALAE